MRIRKGVNMIHTKKLILSLMLAFAVAFMQIGAASAQEPIPPTGTVETITLQMMQQPV